MEAGAGHCWEPAVDQLCDMGPGLVEEMLIKRFNVSFDRNEDNELDLTAEGAHSQARIIHSKDPCYSNTGSGNIWFTSPFSNGPPFYLKIFEESRYKRA